MSTKSELEAAANNDMDMDKFNALIAYNDKINAKPRARDQMSVDALSHTDTLPSAASSQSKSLNDNDEELLKVYS